MALYIIAPFVLAMVILILIKVFSHGCLTQEEREKIETEKKREESERLIKFMEQHPELQEEIRKEFDVVPIVVGGLNGYSSSHSLRHL